MPPKKPRPINIAPLHRRACKTYNAIFVSLCELTVFSFKDDPLSVEPQPIEASIPPKRGGDEKSNRDFGLSGFTSDITESNGGH